MIYGAVTCILVLVISTLVKGEPSRHGNLSVGINPNPSIVATTTVAPGLGGYILAALGQSVAAQKDTTTTTLDDNATSSSISSTRGSPPSAVCYTNIHKCYTDVFYTTPNISSTGSGNAYASQCSNALSAYSSASSSWGLRHSSVVYQTNAYGGTTWIPVTYYDNASTLCDGNARVTYSPAVVLSSTTITTVVSSPTISLEKASVGWIFPISTPSCSINPSDCDGLWQAYSTSSSWWNAATNATSSDAVFPTITASPSIPPCVNSSQSSSNEAFASSFYGCGPCTIFGDIVQLMYFPVPSTISRDMCATTPSPKLTHYNTDVGVPYTGGAQELFDEHEIAPETAVIGSHTFTSGTAYISIKTVWAENRCSSKIGTRVSDAILALPSSSLLSLRYSQNHFQYFATTDKQTGYPFNFADMNTPIPYSAWNGQARCDFPGAADWKCNVIYENDFNPQLAMPPGIRKLNPAWEHCQMWYGGLYDPPYALKPGTTVATPTAPHAKPPVTEAAPSSSVIPTTPTPTALADHTVDDSDSATNSDTQNNGQKTEAAGQKTQANQATQVASHDDQESNYDSQTEAQQNQGGNQNTQVGNQNTQIESQATQVGASNAASNEAPNTVGNVNSPVTADPRVFVFTAGTSTYTATSTDAVIVVGTDSLTAGGSSATLLEGYVISAGTGGLVVDSDPITVTDHASAVTADTTSVAGVVVKIGTQTQTVTRKDSTGAIVVGSKTLSPGGAAATLDDGSVISAASNGIVVGSSIATYSTLAVGPHNDATFNVGGTVVTASGVNGASKQVVIGSITLTAGGSVQTLANGVTVSLASGGTVLVDGTSVAAPSAAPSAVVFTINGMPVTAYETAGVTDVATVDGTVISRDGPAATLSNGGVISMGSRGIVVRQGSSTVPFTAFTTRSASSTSSRSSARSNTAVFSSETDIAAEGTQTSTTASASSTSRGSVVRVSSSTGILASIFMISPLLFAIYL